MAPKKPAAAPAEPPASSSSDIPQKEKTTDGDGARKVAAHPSTAIMMREALKALDSRKGVSSQAVQTYIKQKYPSVDVVRLKHLVRRALKKGLETGTLVRPVNSNVTTGAVGKFRLAPKVMEAKSKRENTDPNEKKEPKATKDGAKQPKKAGATKKTGAAKEQAESEEDSSPPKKSKVAPAKKPKSKATETEEDKGVSASAKPKATKEAKSGAASQSKTLKAGAKAPASRATSRRGKKTAA